jgi:hypothetical protein
MSDVDHPFMALYAEELPRVHDYLERHYDLAQGWTDHLSPVQVLERIEDRGPTLLDLVLSWNHGGGWVRDREGVRAPLSIEGMPPLATRLNRRPVGHLIGPRGGGVDFQLRIPPESRFEAAVGLRGVMSELGLHLHPRDVRMVVSVDDGSGFEPLASVCVCTGYVAGRIWEPVRADLSPYAGRHVTLRLEARPLEPADGVSLIWWGSPRIAGKATRTAENP